MTTTIDRLRRLHGLKSKRSRPDPEPPPSFDYPTPEHRSTGHTSILEKAGQGVEPKPLEGLVVGQVVENEAGACYMAIETHDLMSPRGSHLLGDLLPHSPSIFTRFHPKFHLDHQHNFQRAAFIDTETTGLGGGAGVYAFMVGIGTFENAESDNDQSLIPNPQSPTHFVVRQFFMRSPAEECALLVAISQLLRQCDMLVTFNGRTFDAPLLRTRFRQNQRWLPNAHQAIPLLDSNAPHLDLLAPARRLWRRRLQSCRLINLEQKILRIQRSGDDVPSHLIPLLYTQYVRSNDARQIPSIFYHNREDIVSMVALAEILCRTFAESSKSQRSHDLHGLDWLSLGCCYEAIEAWSEAEATFRQALERLDESEGRVDAFRRLGQLQKRQERWREATETWQLWLTSVSDIDPTPYIELAKYCEWQVQDLEQAEMWAGWALHNLTSAPSWQRTAKQIEELEHRLQRLQRKRQTRQTP